MDSPWTRAGIGIGLILLAYWAAIETVFWLVEGA